MSEVLDQFTCFADGVFCLSELFLPTDDDGSLREVFLSTTSLLLSLTRDEVPIASLTIRALTEGTSAFARARNASIILVLKATG